MAKLRKLGDIILDIEPLLLEMTADHDLQWGEVLFLIHGWLEVHAKSNQEEYNDDGSHPVFSYTALKGDKNE
jgi:hypothetical protein